jgi:hypothetical protein
MTYLQDWKCLKDSSYAADSLREEGENSRHFHYLCVMSAFSGLGAGS